MTGLSKCVKGWHGSCRVSFVDCGAGLVVRLCKRIVRLALGCGFSRK